jgi:transaldolase
MRNSERSFRLDTNSAPRKSCTQVFADSDTTGEQMLAQMSVREGIGVNMTLCFSQEQAAAVYAATKGSKDPVYVSPFLGRLDDQGQNGMDLVRDIKKMYEAGDGYVHVWGASVRTLNHLLAAVALQAELATAPSKVWEEWAAASFPLPEKDFVYTTEADSLQVSGSEPAVGVF